MPLRAVGASSNPVPVHMLGGGFIAQHTLGVVVSSPYTEHREFPKITLGTFDAWSTAVPIDGVVA